MSEATSSDGTRMGRGSISSPRAAASPDAAGDRGPAPEIFSGNSTPSSVEADHLPAFQRECIELFVHAAQLLSIPRSIGEIYGLLYASPQPISMDAVMARLAMSKGSVSQGLRWLREIGAVRSAYIPGDRRDHFIAETELRKLAAGFLKERIAPHLQTAEDSLGRLTESADKVGGGDREFVADRLAKMHTWYRLANQVLPFFLQATGKF